MNTLTYNLPNDIHTYVITCKDEWLDMYMELLIDKNAYKIYVNNELAYEKKIRLVMMNNLKLLSNF